MQNYVIPPGHTAQPEVLLHTQNFFKNNRFADVGLKVYFHTIVIYK